MEYLVIIGLLVITLLLINIANIPFKYFLKSNRDKKIMQSKKRNISALIDQFLLKELQVNNDEKAIDDVLANKNEYSFAMYFDNSKKGK